MQGSIKIASQITLSKCVRRELVIGNISVLLFYCHSFKENEIESDIEGHHPIEKKSNFFLLFLLSIPRLGCKKKYLLCTMYIKSISFKYGVDLAI